MQRPIPFAPAWSEEEAEQRALAWKRGEYPPVSLQEVLGFADAEFEAWTRRGEFPERHRREVRGGRLVPPRRPSSSAGPGRQGAA
ncbi:MAG TPA: hypothetical protein VD970_02120 [Acetobacteraceae bacterium]|nr:hypothetical protein [Acetobacteraceae bacterium]